MQPGVEPGSRLFVCLFIGVKSHILRMCLCSQSRRHVDNTHVASPWLDVHMCVRMWRWSLPAKTLNPNLNHPSWLRFFQALRTIHPNPDDIHDIYVTTCTIPHTSFTLILQVLSCRPPTVPDLCQLLINPSSPPPSLPQPKPVADRAPPPTTEVCTGAIPVFPSPARAQGL
jgi:hypothetical protein